MGWGEACGVRCFRRARARQSFVPHDHDQPSERVQSTVGHLLATWSRSACPVLSSLPRRRFGVGGSGEGEGPTRVRARECSRRVGVGAATRGADEEVAVGHAVRVALMWRSRLLATKEAGALPPALDARHLEVDPACGP